MEGDIFIDELNEEQREAVLYTDGPSLVIAGAGAGKTRVLTYKIAYLLMQGLAPWNILALTFTNKAAKEMQSRIAAQVGTDLADRLWMGTFHSIFARILRIEAAHLGFSSRFTIYDQSDSRSLIKTIIKELKLDEKQYKPNHIAAQISNAKNRLIWPEAYLSTYRSFSTSIEREGKLIYFGGDPAVNQLAQEVRSDITAIPYDQHPVVERDGQVFLPTRYGDYPVRIPNGYFLINLNAARLACRQLGVKDADFYAALSEYSLSLPV